MGAGKISINAIREIYFGLFGQYPFHRSVRNILGQV